MRTQQIKSNHRSVQTYICEVVRVPISTCTEIVDSLCAIARQLEAALQTTEQHEGVVAPAFKRKQPMTPNHEESIARVRTKHKPNVDNHGNSGIHIRKL